MPRGNKFDLKLAGYDEYRHSNQFDFHDLIAPSESTDDTIINNTENGLL